MGWKDGSPPGGQRRGKHPVSEPFRLVTDPIAICSLNK